MEQRISLITLGVQDLARERAFYEALGWAGAEQPDDEVCFFQAGGSVLGLWTALGGHGAPGVELAQNVRTPEAVGPVLEDAERAGGRIVRPAAQAEWGGTSGAFADPDLLKSYTRAEENRTTSLTADALANLSGRYRLLSAEFGLRAMLQAGKQGRRLGADLSGEKRLDGGRYAFNARVSLYDWDDPLRPDRSATSFMYVLGAGYRLLQMADMRLEWEHDMNRLIGHRFRVLGALSLRISR